MPKKIKIGYFGYSSDLTHPADRRRLNFYALNSNTEVVVNPTTKCKVEILVITQKYNLLKIKEKFPNVPIVYDLIEGFLLPDSKFKDIFHGIYEGTFGDFGLPIKKNTEYYKQFSICADHVICSTPEQYAIVRLYNKNVSVILDSHEEFQIQKFRKKKSKYLSVFWEGQPYTVSNLNKLQKLLTNKEIVEQINVVTDTQFNKFAMINYQSPTIKIVSNKIRYLKYFNLIDWSNQNIIDYSRKSNIQLIPLNLRSLFQMYKPENRLLISWRLGLPALVSPIYSYTRVINNMSFDSTCRNDDEWISKSLKIQKENGLAEFIVKEGQDYIESKHNREILLNAWRQVFEKLY